jgi:hypothetical protein
MSEVIKKGRYWVEVDAKGNELKRSKVRFEPSKKAAPKKKVVKKKEE